MYDQSLKYHVANITAAALFSFVFAMTVSHFVMFGFFDPEENIESPRRAPYGRHHEEYVPYSEYEPILESGFFEIAGEQEEDLAMGGAEEVLPETEISHLHLIGTITGPRSFARAIIKKGRTRRSSMRRSRRRRMRNIRTAGNGARKSDIYKTGSDVYGYTLVKIAEESVYLKYNERVEELELFPEDEQNGDAPGTARRTITDGDVRVVRRNISRSEIQQKVLSNMDNALRGLRAGPYRKNGKIAGYKLIRVRPYNVLYKLGARSGDIVKRVNGRAINSTQKLLQMWGQVKRESKIDVDIKRGGKIIRYSFNITQ